MDAGLVVVAAVLGVFLLVPLVFAWVSTNPRRWARVEGVLGREPKGGKVPRWLWGIWIGFSALYVVMGAAMLLGGRERWLGAAWVLQGTSWGLLGGWYYRCWRQEQAAARSAETQVQDRAEPR
jgi:hypothetical protein